MTFCEKRRRCLLQFLNKHQETPDTPEIPDVVYYDITTNISDGVNYESDFDNVISSGSMFEASIALLTGYELTSVVVKMGDQTLQGAYNSETGNIVIMNVTGDIQISVEAVLISQPDNPEAPIKYSITYIGYYKTQTWQGELDSITIEKVPISGNFDIVHSGYEVEPNQSYEATITTKYDKLSIKITMGEEDVSRYASAGNINIPAVIGNVVIELTGSDKNDWN